MLGRRNMHLGIGAIWFYFLLFSPIAECSRITMTNGIYDGILVALHPDTDARNCIQLIQNITEAFQYSSSQLSVGTNGRARFGSLRILIPSSWGAGMSECQSLPAANVTRAEMYELYDNADFKVSSEHPFTAGKLPWTKQYKGCENESESIYVPAEFFKTVDFDSSTRGRILLAEWAKFRYGVFEEHAYFADPRYPPCYSLEGKIFYTGCSSSSLGPLANSPGSGAIPLEDCERLLQENLATLQAQLKSANSSLLLAPHLSNMAYFCDKQFQIGVSPTKQNILCERRSVPDVIFSHNDFKNSGRGHFFPVTRKGRPGSVLEKTTPKISLVRQGHFAQGYAFVLEDDDNMRQFGRIKYIKQAMAQILQLVKTGTEVAVFRYEGSHFTSLITTIRGDADREAALKLFPDLGTLGLNAYISARYGKSKSNQVHFPGNDKKKKSFLQILDTLAIYNTTRWHMLTMSSSPPADMIDVLPELANSPHSISLMTFDESKEWLQFNTIPNTKGVLFLPSCADEPRNCFGEATSLFVDSFGAILASNNSALRHYIHKVVDFTFVGEMETTFTISQENFVGGLENFQLWLPIYTNDSTIILYSPSKVLCPSSSLLQYDLVVQFDTGRCPYETGEWTIKVTGGGQDAAAMVYTLNGVGETPRGSESNSNFVTEIFLGQRIQFDVFPTITSLPVYASISTEFEKPVLDADVTLQIVHQNQNSENTKSIPLEDNGVDPDLAANDGVYSAFITDFNPHPSFHSGRITVKTVRGAANSILSLNFVNGGGGALLDDRMTSKCCGSLIPIETVAGVGTASYSAIIPSFRTGEEIEEGADIFPPSRIQSHLQIIDTGQLSLTIEFKAPGADHSTGIVNYYDLCCTNLTSGILDDKLCVRLLELGGHLCTPVPSGAIQRCAISKSTLAVEFYNGSPTASSPSTLFCGIRGVDSAGNLGPLSFDLLEIKIDSESRNLECNRVSDGCLPMDVFWALIGCVIGLVIILVIVVLCWCCLTRQQRERKRNKKVGKDNNWIDGLHHESLNNVYINQAYIQDSNGQLKLVASDGVFHSLEFDTNNDADATGISTEDRRSVTPRAMLNREFDAETQGRHVSWNGDRRQVMSSSSSIATHPASEHGTSLKSFPPPPPRSIQSNPTRSEGRTQELQIPRLQIVDSQQSLPSISSAVDIADEQVYASVFRTGRKGNSPIVMRQDNVDISSFQLNMHQKPERDVYPVMYSRQPPLLKSIKNDTNIQQENQPERSTSTFLPSKSQIKCAPEKFQQTRVRPLPPVRLDHFPSSESEVYSDMSQIMKTPTFRTTNFTRHQVSKKLPNSQIRPVSSPGGGFSTTPSSNSVPNLRSPPHHKSMEIQRPAGSRMASSPPPPPPPPRKQSRYDDAPQNNHVSSRQSSTGQFDGDNNNEYDDDSDNWDNYEEDATRLHIQSTPGTSYA